MKTRYKGMAKNAHRLFVTCALTNLYLMRRRFPNFVKSQTSKYITQSTFLAFLGVTLFVVAQQASAHILD